MDSASRFKYVMAVLFRIKNFLGSSMSEGKNSSRYKKQQKRNKELRYEEKYRKFEELEIEEAIVEAGNEIESQWSAFLEGCSRLKCPCGFPCTHSDKEVNESCTEVNNLKAKLSNLEAEINKLKTEKDKLIASNQKLALNQKRIQQKMAGKRKRVNQRRQKRPTRIHRSRSVRSLT
jgi:hypothetical protein